LLSFFARARALSQHKVDQALYLEVEEAAQDEHRKRNEFARLIFEWGFAEFKKAGSLDALIGRKTTIKK
jgi:hypothetical protein